MSRQTVIRSLQTYYDDGRFLADLRRRVAIPTESQNPARRPELYQYLEAEIPYLDRVFSKDARSVVEQSEVIVIANGHPTYKDVPSWMREGQTLVDLVRLVEKRDVRRGDYVGLAW